MEDRVTKIPQVSKYPQVISSVDVVILTLVGGALNVLIHRRKNIKEPYFNAWALPGGQVHADVDTNLNDTVARILKTKVNIHSLYVEQFYTFASATRDPRSWSSSITHFALVPNIDMHQVAEGSLLMPVDRLPTMAFDHNEIVDKCVRHVRNKSLFSALPCYLLPPVFTLAELQKTYEQITNEKLNSSVFRRKLNELDFLDMVEGSMVLGKHRPAQLYKVKPGQLAVFDKTL